MRLTSIAIAAAAATSLSFAPSVRAAESYDGCRYTITSLPAVIGSQGVWCLKADVNTRIETGAAIMVQANNATLDCNHFKIGGLSAGSDTKAIGIEADGVNNFTVRNCNIRGFQTGIRDLDSAGTLVEDNLFEGNRYTAVNMSGTGGMVRNNRISDTGFWDLAAEAFGIYAEHDTDIVDNVISGVYASTAGDPMAANGIATFLGTGAVTGNRVRFVHSQANGSSFGIMNVLPEEVVVAGNIVNLGDVADGIGVNCDLSGEGVVSANIIVGVANASSVVGCTDSGNTLDPD